MKGILLSLLACYQMTSQRADFDGEQLKLEGPFTLVHELGDVKAGRAILTHPPLKKGSKKTPSLALEKGVQICVREAKSPFTVSADHAYCELSPQAPLSFWDLRFIELMGSVVISEPGGLTAKGGSALYQKKQATLYPAPPCARCELTNKQGTIEAVSAVFDLDTEDLVCQDPIGSLAAGTVRFSASEMTWRREKKEIFFQGNVSISHMDQITAESNSGTIAYQNEWEFDALRLFGSVRLLSKRVQDKESFALADELIYLPGKKMVILSAEAPKKVLFWQEDVRLSASEVHIRRDEATGKDTVEGIGDVHFAFDLEEQNEIKEFLRNVL